MRTQVAVIGAGPAGLLLSHLLDQEGIASVVVETRSRAYVGARIRAGILESSTVSLLDDVGPRGATAPGGVRAPRGLSAGARGAAPRRFRRPGGPQRLGLRPDRGDQGLGRARDAADQQFRYEVGDTRLHDLATDHPFVTYTLPDGGTERLDADVVVGCDGSFGPSRAGVPAGARQVWERIYPYSRLGVLADVPPRPTSSSTPGIPTASPCTRCARPP